jgi:hypothetical protein
VGFFDKLQNLDRRIIYVIVLLAIAIPLINPIGVPLSISALTQSVYDMADNLQPGDKVLFSLDYSPGGSPDVHPQAIAMMNHLMSKGVQVVMVSFWDAGPMYGEQLIAAYPDKVYGTDYINLGYIPGGENAIRLFGADVNTQKKDFRGNDPKSFPIMQGIVDCRDFALVVDFVSGNPGIQEWVRQVQGPLDIKIAAGAVTVNVPTTMPFVQSGQVIGLLQGLRGAAEYELLMGQPGDAVAMMDGQSLGHVAIIAFILIGNIAFFAAGRGKKKA